MGRWVTICLPVPTPMGVTMKRLGCWVVLSSALLTMPALAMRCGGELVSRGLHLVEVLERCGDPVFRREHVEYRGYQFGVYLASPVLVDEFVYDLGPQKFRRRLRFEDGELRRIDILKKGSFRQFSH